MGSEIAPGESRLDRDRLIVFDTTLRDGMQTPDVGVGLPGRFYIAKALDTVGVDVIEAGFAANSVDYPVIKEVSRFIGSRERAGKDNVPQICSLARLMPDDVRLAYETLRYADPDRRRIHIFIGTSEDLINHSHGKREEEIVRMIRENVSLARELMDEEGWVEYSSEDAMRTPFDFLARTVYEAIASGADVINVPDTTGVADPDDYFNAIRRLRDEIPEIAARGIVISTHVHNDSGRAVEGSIKGVKAGARQVEGTVLQLGERAGNADWPAVVTDARIKDYGVDVSHIKTEMFHNLSNIVAAVTGKPKPLNHPVTGVMSHSTSSGIHVKGVLKNSKTYYAIPPEMVGKKGEVVLGQTSGVNTSAWFLGENGYGEVGVGYTMKQVQEFTERAKRLSVENGAGLTRTEAMLLADEIIRGASGSSRIRLSDYSSSDSMENGADIEAELMVDGILRSGRGSGVGPVDAYMNAIEQALGIEPGSMKLRIWEERAVYNGKGAPGFEMLDAIEFSDSEKAMLAENNGHQSSGQRAEARSCVEIEYCDRVYHGRGRARNIAQATYKAITSAVDAIVRLNRIEFGNKDLT